MALTWVETRANVHTAKIGSVGKASIIWQSDPPGYRINVFDVGLTTVAADLESAKRRAVASAARMLDIASNLLQT